MERRATNQPVELRELEDGTKAIEGYAAVFYRADDPGTQYSLWEDSVERISPLAFREALKRKDDARALFNHNPDNLLGRVSAGTLGLKVDKVGLRYSIRFDESDPDHQRVARKLERGDLSGSSFAFRATKVLWSTEKIEGKRVDVRTVQDLELFDVGPVTYPAYQSTTAATRNDEAAKEEHQAWMQEQEAADQVARQQMDALSLAQARLQLIGAELAG